MKKLLVVGLLSVRVAECDTENCTSKACKDYSEIIL